MHYKDDYFMCFTTFVKIALLKRILNMNVFLCVYLYVKSYIKPVLSVQPIFFFNFKVSLYISMQLNLQFRS